MLRYRKFNHYMTAFYCYTIEFIHNDDINFFVAQCYGICSRSQNSWKFRHTQLVRVATRCAVEVFPKQCEFRELIEEDFLAKWLPVRNPLYILYIYTTLLINNLMFRADGQGSGHISGPEHHRLLHCHNCTGCGECWSAGWSTRCAGQDRHADKHNGVTHYNAHHTRQCHHARWRRHYSQWRHYTRWRHYTQWGHYSRCWNYSRRWHYGQPNHSQPNHTRFD